MCIFYYYRLHISICIHVSFEVLVFTFWLSSTPGIVKRYVNSKKISGTLHRFLSNSDFLRKCAHIFSYEPVRLVVRAEFHHDKVDRLDERLNWLAHNIFSWPHYQNRGLILLCTNTSDMVAQLEKVYNWVLNEDYNDVYSRIMNNTCLPSGTSS